MGNEAVGEMTRTEKRIAEMLKENTGRSILDSGDCYGRAWERRQGIVDFRQLPETNVDVWDGEVTVSASLFHWLVGHLELSDEAEKVQRRFKRFAKHDGWAWLREMEEFAEREIEKGRAEEEIYLVRTGDIWNSYNYENVLAGTIQGMWYAEGGKQFVLLQIHGGCDVRGGYTAPQVFEVNDIEYWYINQTHVTAQCERCEEVWTSDDSGYTWYGDAVSGKRAGELWKLRRGKVVKHIGCGGRVSIYCDCESG